MSISEKNVKGIRYLYFSYYDPVEKKKKEVYCGPADSKRAIQKATALMKTNLEDKAARLAYKLVQFDHDLQHSKPRKKPKRNGKIADGLQALEILRNTKMHDPEVYYKSCEHMDEVPDGSVQLIVTSPPYNVGKDYGTYKDRKNFDSYLDFLERVWKECKRKLCTGGRIAVNIADTYRQPFIPMHSYIIEQLQGLELLMRGIIYWNKGSSVGESTAWGSWRSANATLRDTGEFIVVFCKDDYKLPNGNRISTITAKEFTEYTKSLWDFPAADPKKEGHPAPFPEELPKRLMQLYTFLGDTVLDPFLGSGTTVKVAKAWGRKSIGYEIDSKYKSIIDKRVASVQSLAVPTDAFAVKGLSLEDYGIEEQAITQAVSALTKASS